MSLDRWIALVILSIALVYSYAAFFTMDQLLPPLCSAILSGPLHFPRFWRILVSSLIVLGLEKNKDNKDDGNRLP